MNWYTIRFKNGTFADGYAKWDGESVESLLVELGFRAIDAKLLGIAGVSVDHRPYVTYVDFRAREKGRAA